MGITKAIKMEDTKVKKQKLWTIVLRLEFNIIIS